MDPFIIRFEVNVNHYPQPQPMRVPTEVYTLIAQGEEVMAKLQEVRDALTAAAEAARNEKAEVDAKFNELNTIIADLKTKVGTGGAATEAELEEILTMVKGVQTDTQNITTAEVVPEPTPEPPGPPITPPGPGNPTPPAGPEVSPPVRSSVESARPKNPDGTSLFEDLGGPTITPPNAVPLAPAPGDAMPAGSPAVAGTSTIAPGRTDVTGANETVVVATTPAARTVDTPDGEPMKPSIFNPVPAAATGLPDDEDVTKNHDPEDTARAKAERDQPLPTAPAVPRTVDITTPPARSVFKDPKK